MAENTAKVTSKSACPRWLGRWIEFSVRRAWFILGAALLVFVVSAYFTSRLDLKTDLVELLPTDSPSVLNLEKMRTRVATYSNLAVGIQSPDLKASQKFADDVAARVNQFPKSEVLSVDHNIAAIKDFYSKNKYLYADVEDLRGFRDRLEKRIKEETEGAVVESLDDEPAPKTDLQIDKLKEKYESKVKSQDKYPDGYYVNPDRSLVAVFIYPPSGSSGHSHNVKLVDDVNKVIKDLDPAKYHPEMKVGLSGDIKTGLEEREALAADIQFVSLLCLALMAVLFIVYYRSFRVVIIMGAPMLLGLVATLGITKFTIGYLNTATAFLTSIIAGNGINFMILYSARFFEEIRTKENATLVETLKASAWGTLKGTLIAGIGASIAYGSLIFAGFRGFRQFGIIGGIGMVLCWLSTFMIGPALIAVLHSRKPLADHKTGTSKFRPGVVFGKIVNRRPRVILLISLLICCGSVLAIIPWSFDPFEYDFHKLRNVAGYKGGSAELSLKIDKIFDLPQSPTPVVAERAEDVPHMKDAILAAPSARAIIGGVKTLQEILPSDQEEKLAILGDIRAMIDRKLDFLNAEDRKKVEENRPTDDLKVLSMNDVPDTLARAFTESDGTRGRLLYVYARRGDSLLDGKYLLKFANFIRGIDYGPGVEAVPVGQPMVFADMIEAILKDGFKVSVAALIGVILLLIFAFRSRLGVGTILMSVFVGTIWMLGFAALTNMKLNFLNFVVIPITLGIGVDYGTNIFSRYKEEGRGSIPGVISSTGGAVLLCSLTTIIGYATLITSNNLALRSFGLIADIGEITCIIAAELVMTAYIVWRERDGRKKGITS